MRRLIFCIPLLLFVFLAPQGGYCEKTPSKQDLLKKEKRLEDVKKQITEEKKGIKLMAEKETNILGELDNINKNLNEKREELKKIEGSLSEVQRNVASANANITRLERDRKVLSERLIKRLKAMYKMRRGEALKVLFSSDSADDLGRKHKYLTMIMDSDSELIDGYEKTLQKLGAEKKKLSSLYKDVVVSKNAAAAKKNETEALQRQKTALLNEVKSEKDRKIKTVKELEQAAAALTNLLNKLRSQGEEEAPVPAGTGFAAMKGRLPMPVAGQVVSFYGKVKHPKFNTVTFNNGIIIDAPSGTPARSVFEGKVIYVGWLKGYGQVLIVDHKGGFYTLFAHLSRASKGKGDTVRKGEEVGLVGDTGTEAASGLYFEIRQHGVPRDPMGWLTGK